MRLHLLQRATSQHTQIERITNKTRGKGVESVPGRRIMLYDGTRASPEPRTKNGTCEGELVVVVRRVASLAHRRFSVVHVRWHHDILGHGTRWPVQHIAVVLSLTSHKGPGSLQAPTATFWGTTDSA